ncbi:Protein-glutamate methylesterase/protein-glutamine glutaminase [Paenibacillus allorhizoplanae]|uniref:Protein-glutamate methylesterase/protein-glutamine glutaminase n=1 Tax=Paenibacillus allorhizoplanae TaxID=2905648 RepID=A0ABN8H3P1_9BACL|nr:response regulator [Paenibacillus allorhizoplanae]CAH1226916.1 Protein-glutamate methylesterase/protein-glutamine glutaminase [Paenibacillus allorhizoplanae]
MPIKVLIVDDELPVRERFTQHIPWGEHGFACIGAAGHGQEALTMMEKELPHLLLVDITMPVMDGLELAELVRKRWPEISIVFLTAHSEFDYARQALLLGAKNYLLKIALSKEQIIAACQAAVEDVRLILKDKASKTVTMDRAEDSEQKSKYHSWKKRESLVVRWSESNAHQRKGIWSEISKELSTELKRHVAVLWVGIDVFEELWNQSTCPIGETADRQQELAARIEALAKDEQQIISFPLGKTRLLCVITSDADASSKNFEAALYQTAQVLLSREGDVKLFIWNSGSLVGETAEMDALISEGLEKLSRYFYERQDYISLHSTLLHVNYQEISVMDQVELLSKATKAFYGGGAVMLQEVVQQLTTLPLGASPYSPAQLIRLSGEIMLKCPWLEQDSSLIQFHNMLLFIERWDDFIRWWNRVFDLLTDPKLHPEMNVTRWEVQQVCQYIHENYMKEIRLPDLSERVGLNTIYLGQLFKQVTGEYFNDYVHRTRMLKAQQLLRQTGMKVYEVAAEVGVSDYRYFCKLFKKHIGISPSEYKHKYIGSMR